ncbi:MULTISPECIES: hypothetical protein [unclassified Meiothermus]|uniref:hypothetical protein n=1 Tax=unclassified Meiothermus TaxID=370471 RepID=UPI000D7BBCDA|nr:MULTISPECIES: hypothetical protein [unclassified Meiothermus]PZA07812.1 hypothetical protein DNA98_05765 [Meiothermus sp. Pnk-1]RYM38885.1 hypothetical protein EWH23_03920 [Meiothermus sp. PNK-Is4]
MSLLAVLHQGDSRYYPLLLKAALSHRLPLKIHAAQPAGLLPAALAGLVPLGFEAALLEAPDFQTRAFELVEALEPEARGAGRVDLVIPERKGLRGYYLEPIALGNLLMRYAMGSTLLWMGKLRPELIGGLRGIKQVSAVSSSFAEGDSFLGKLPHSQRGHTTVPERVEALARHVDVILYGGGSLPIAALQPYHTLLALVDPPKEALKHVGQYLGPDELPRFFLSAVADALGHGLPPEAFG